MEDEMIKYSVKKPFTVLVAVIIVLVIGLVSLTGSRDSRHRVGTQCIGGALENHAADGRDGILQPHGHTHAAKQPHPIPVRSPFLSPDSQDFELLHDEQQTAEPGYPLRNHGGQSRPPHAQMQVHDKEQIQAYVQKGGHHQENHRRPTVPQSPDDARCHII